MYCIDLLESKVGIVNGITSITHIKINYKEFNTKIYIFTWYAWDTSGIRLEFEWVACELWYMYEYLK